MLVLLDGVERTGADARFALDALLLVDHKRLFERAADRAYRAAAGALGAALAQRRIDGDAFELAAVARRAAFFVNMRLIFRAEVLDRAYHRGRRGLSKAAERRGGDGVRKLQQQLDVPIAALAGHNALEDFQHALGALTARHALAARLSRAGLEHGKLRRNGASPRRRG